MLQHEHSEADEARVTAAELASALASLESRKETSGDTVALGEAVRELNLDATPQEILAEVEAQRMAHTRRVRQMPKRWKAAVFAFTTFCLLTGIVTWGSVTAIRPPLPPLVQETFADFQQKVLVQDQTAQGPLVRTLAEVPEGRIVRISANAVEEASMCRMPRRGPLLLSSQAERYLTWPVVKQNNELYVHGWVRERLSNQAARQATLEVYNRPDAPALGPHPVQITIRLSAGVFGNAGIIYEGFPETGMERFFFANLRPNAHTWAKW